MKQDVAEPEQIAVQRADDEQPGLATEIDGCKTSATRLGPLPHDDEPAAEEQRKYGHEFLIEKDMRQEPGAEVVPLGAAHQ